MVKAKLGVPGLTWKEKQGAQRQNVKILNPVRAGLVGLVLGFKAREGH